MFSELVESVPSQSNTKKTWTVAASALVQCVGLGILILLPLIYTEALPTKMLRTMAVLPYSPHRVSVTPILQESRTRITETRIFHSTTIFAPTTFPPHAQAVREEVPSEPEGGPGGDPLTLGLSGNVLTLAPPTVMLPIAAPPATPAVAQPSGPVRIGGVVQEAKLSTRIRPVYPPLAMQTHTQGNVVLHAIIGRDGTIAQLQVVSGHPLLIQAALDAVRRWRYQPTLLNGEPVEVDTTITVSFVLNR